MICILRNDTPRWCAVIELARPFLAVRYDANGNWTYDAHKEIEKIEYNYLNQPEKITFTNDRVITFLYDATGRKLRKTVTGGGLKEQRDYLDGIEYKDGKPDQFHHSEGTVRRDENGVFHYYFVLRDHLGNTRVTFSDLNDDDKIDEYKEIIQINNYYAFGLNMEGNWNGKDGAHKYQYNEKEWNDDFGLGWNDYNTRRYDPAMARFAGIDLLADSYSFQTPYAYAANNPIRYRDFMGMSPNDPNSVELPTLTVTAKRMERPAISDDFRFQNLYDQLLGRINKIRENQLTQTISTTTVPKQDDTKATISEKKPICAKSLEFINPGGDVKFCRIGGFDFEFQIGIEKAAKNVKVPVFGLIISCEEDATTAEVAAYFAKIVKSVNLTTQTSVSDYEGLGTEDLQAEIRL